MTERFSANAVKHQQEKMRRIEERSTEKTSRAGHTVCQTSTSPKTR